MWLDEVDEEGEEEEGGTEAVGHNGRGADDGFRRRRRLLSASSNGTSTSSSRGRYAGFNLRVVLNPFLAPDTGKLTRFNNRWLRRLKRWKAGILILTRTALFNDSEEPDQLSPEIVICCLPITSSA